MVVLLGIAVLHVALRHVLRVWAHTVAAHVDAEDISHFGLRRAFVCSGVVLLLVLVHLGVVVRVCLSRTLGSIGVERLQRLLEFFRGWVKAPSESLCQEFSSMDTLAYLVALCKRVAAHAHFASSPILLVTNCQLVASTPFSRRMLTTKPQAVQIQSPGWTHMGPEFPVLTIGGSSAALLVRLWLPLRLVTTFGLTPGPMLFTQESVIVPKISTYIATYPIPHCRSFQACATVSGFSAAARDPFEASVSTTEVRGSPSPLACIGIRSGTVPTPADERESG